MCPKTVPQPQKIIAIWSHATSTAYLIFIIRKCSVVKDFFYTETRTELLSIEMRCLLIIITLFVVGSFSDFLNDHGCPTNKCQCDQYCNSNPPDCEDWRCPDQQTDPPVCGVCVGVWPGNRLKPHRQIENSTN
ncbi:hypothetical protein RCL_jg11673.t1 [Rhizophagus clarus]|uniref:Uncharacterized protein n=1 Tax=Rhizophagus clarus TaxID=94130 RepID=A0A8H3MDY6_9GLOM|nr:hypothetical protein RCL_jg11673.t1 [Rhizophagus clarus]